MFIERLKKAFSCKEFNEHNFILIENCDLLQLKYESSSLKYSLDGVRELFLHIPERDKLTVKISYSDDEFLEINSNNYDIDQFKEIQGLNDFLSDEENLQINITIHKKIIDSKLSIYDFSEFSSWFFNKQLFEFIKCCDMLKKNVNSGIIFECLDDDVLLRSGFLNFNTELSVVKIIDNRLHTDIFENQDVCRIVANIPIVFKPDDFHIIGQTRNVPEIYTNYLKKVEMFLSIVYLSNQGIFTNNEVQIILKGYRLVDEQINFEKEKYNPNFFNIYDWAYSAGNLSDKLTLARNIISLSCKWRSILDIDETVLPAIQSNYNLYIKGNVKDYLTLKKEALAALQNYCNNVSEAINKYSSSLKSNYIAFLGYIATLLFTKGIKKDLSEIFTSEVSILTSLILAGSLLICIISVIELLFKYRYFNKIINSLKSQFEDVMEKAELKKTVDENPILCTAKSNFWWSLGIVSAIWVVSVIVLFLALDYISGNVKLLFFVNLIKNAAAK